MKTIWIVHYWKDEAERRVVKSETDRVFKLEGGYPRQLRKAEVGSRVFHTFEEARQGIINRKLREIASLESQMKNIPGEIAAIRQDIAKIERTTEPK